MAVKSVVTTPLTWGSLMGRGNREPLDDTQLNYSYTDLLWELNQRTGNPNDASYTIGKNKGGSGNFYVGLITSVPYVNINVTDTKLKVPSSHYTKGTDGALVPETMFMKGPWYVSYCGTDTRYGNGGVGKYGFNPDGNGNTYYADRIVLRQEMDYALDKDFVRRTQLGTYYTGVGHFWDSYNTVKGGSRNYAGSKECPDDTYFPTSSYSEIFNDYTYNKATGNYSHAEGYHSYNLQNYGHVEGYYNIGNAEAVHAEGWQTKATGKAAHSEGTSTQALGTSSHSEGQSTISKESNAHSEGHSTIAYIEAHAEGVSTVAYAYAHSEGTSTFARGSYSHSEGYGSYATGTNAHAENSSYANGKNSHSGGQATAGGENSFAHGTKGTLASGTNSVSFISGTASGSSSFNVNGTASGENSVVLTGTASNINAVSLGGTASGSNSVAIKGSATTTNAVAITGTASGENSIALGGTASGSNSVSVKGNAITTNAVAITGTASGENSIALDGTASGSNSVSIQGVAKSTDSVAIGQGSVAETGQGAMALIKGHATGQYSLATGEGTLASGKDSASFGNSTQATNFQSIAFGTKTISSGVNSTTFGNISTASGENSFASGTSTKVQNKGEHAFGNYNVSVPASDNTGTLFTIGDGTADDKRHNIVAVYNNRDVNIEDKNVTNHTAGTFSSNIDSNFTSVVGTDPAKPVSFKHTLNGNETIKINGTSDTRKSGITYEGYESSHTMTVSGLNSTYSYNTCYEYVKGNSGHYVLGTISERSDVGIYESSPKICIHGDVNTDNTYVDLSSFATYLYGRKYTYIGQNVHDADSKSNSIYVKGTNINESSDNHNVNTGTHNITVSGNTKLTTGSLDITSGITNLNLNTTHVHVNNAVCIKGTTDATFKGNNNTKIGQDAEGNKTSNFLVVSTTTGNIETPTLTTKASTKYTENVGTKSVTVTGTLTEINSKYVSTSNKESIGTYTTGTTYQYTSSNKTDAVKGTRTQITDGIVSITNKASIGTYITGTSYEFVVGPKDDKGNNTLGRKQDIVYGTRTNITKGYVSETNQDSVGTYTTGTTYEWTSSNKTDAVQGTRTSITKGHDYLEVQSNGRTEKITGEKITDVNSGNINTYTDDSHDTRLHTRSTYIETVHGYIGDKTNTSITGKYSVGIGQGIKTSKNTNVSVGKYNKDEESYFSVGIGTSNDNRKNAFWISQGSYYNEKTHEGGANGVAYFTNNTYIYANTYDPDQYPNNKEDKSWSQVVTYNMYKNSYTYLYKTMNDKFDTFGSKTYFVKSIDAFTYTPISYTLHFTTQTFNKESNTWPISTYQYTIPQAQPGALENDDSGNAGLMSARDKARLDSIWEGDKQIAGIQISTGTWTVYKNDGTTTYTLENIEHQSSSITSISVEYGFKVKWSGTWKWTISNQKNAERCEGTWGTTLPAVNMNSDSWTSSVLSNTGTIATETIYAAKRGLIISGYPASAGATNNGTQHLGSIVPASGEDSRGCSVSWSVYRLLFYGQATQADADAMNMSVISTLTTAKITGRSWTINYTATGSTCFVMAYPAAWGDISTIKKNGVEIITSSFLKIGSVKYTNGAGLQQNYNIYRSGVGTADMSITIS